MIPYFSTAARIEALETVASRWESTPFRENSAVCGGGGGVSCHNLAAEIYFETGALTRFTVPRGSVRAFLNAAPDAMLQYIDEHFSDRFVQIAIDGDVLDVLLPGDLLVMSENDRSRHVAISLAHRRAVQVFRRHGVMISRLEGSSFKIEAVRRPLTHG